MKKTFIKIIASIMVVTTMAVSMTTIPIQTSVIYTFTDNHWASHFMC
jgi:hypothetical protein